MKIRVKLFANLGVYIPKGTADGPTRNEADFDADDDATVSGVLGQLGVPNEFCHLVLVNGFFIPPSERDGRTLVEGDDLAVWPPVAGG
ncbi:MAG: MoaD/ThiS family protein [Alphaproteobacteria bacterium]|jgi:sulfur-carrier protein|nr:MoaD/ThiS family protein [Alphaproteobacteria bacterium]